MSVAIELFEEWKLIPVTSDWLFKFSLNSERMFDLGYSGGRWPHTFLNIYLTTGYINLCIADNSNFNMYICTSISIKRIISNNIHNMYNHRILNKSNEQYIKVIDFDPSFESNVLAQEWCIYPSKKKKRKKRKERKKLIQWSCRLTERYFRQASPTKIKQAKIPSSYMIWITN